MTTFDSETDFDSDFGIPGSLTDTTNSSPIGLSEPPYERRRAIDSVDRLETSISNTVVLGSQSAGKPSFIKTMPESALPDTGSAPVGLSDPQYVSQRRKMLDTVNRLREIGAHLELDIPVIAVVGAQSAGKSSLIESISGVTLPRASGTCTRCPTECRLSRSSEPWRCAVSLRIVKENGLTLPQPRVEQFGDLIYSKTLVTERIRRAQCAILNPATPYTYYLEAPPDVLEERDLSFSSNMVCLEISGRDVENLSFVDLPGLIVGGEPNDARLVQDLAEEYIGRESCIILLTIACETDFENQIAHRLAAQFDPLGARTIGVLTKPDRISTGEEAIWISKIQRDGGVEYYAVKNPDSEDIRNGITFERAGEKEAEFFSTKTPWCNLEWLFKRRLGTDKLTRRLGQVLSDLISKRLPELQGEVDRLLEEVNDDISRLPSAPTSEPVVEIMQLIGAFVRSIDRIVAGAPDDDGLIQTLRGPREIFKKEIRQTAPDFRPLERPTDGSSPPALPEPRFLLNEEAELDWQSVDPNRAIFIDDVMTKANSAVTRELPNNFPYSVKQRYISTVVKLWDRPSRQYFDFARKELNKHIKLQIDNHFSQYTHGHLKQRVTSILKGHIEKCADAAAQHLNSLLEEEREPFTMNECYFMEYHSKFMDYYKGARQRARMGLEIANGPQQANLPADRMDPAIGIMADVRAYFQVAYKRFVDNVPMGIDRTLVRGMTQGLAGVLFSGLAIDGPGAFERCRTLLSEPEDIVERRSELERRRKRLFSAREELIDVFG